jgi:toxin YoeB
MKYVFVDESWEDYAYWQNIDKKKSKESVNS